ncbi:MAG: hypothetical protein V8R91_14145 [Butyricimonas faecihominis]
MATASRAYYKSLRADGGKALRSFHRQDIRRDMPNLGVNKLWNMLGSNGLPVGRDWLYRLLHLHDLMIKQKKYPVRHDGFRGVASPVPEPGERASFPPNQVWVSDITYLSGQCRFRVSLAGNPTTGWEVHPPWTRPVP